MERIETRGSDTYGEFSLSTPRDAAGMPDVTVLMSVYNGQDFLRECFAGILNQTFRSFECLVIDDGSTDRSREIVAEYADRDARIRMVSQRNIGLTKSLNRGIRLARGKYIARQDVDDQSLPERLARQFRAVVESGLAMVGSRAVYGGKGRSRVIPTRREIACLSVDYLKYHNIFIHGTLFFQAEVLKNNPYDDTYTYTQDYELIIRLMKKGYPVGILDDVLYSLNWSPGRISRAKAAEQLACGRKACRQHYGTDRYYMSDKNRLTRLLLRCHRMVACLKNSGGHRQA